ncbi:Protein F52A8 [Aphelenchoides besseyi]|nr:Protein F52A8 [Aphelenchoides besseyi]KAI6207358.1 Protein F52A8 [Aphelenchoides besseyi]
MRLLIGLLIFCAVALVQADFIEELKDLDVLKFRESPRGCPVSGIGGQCPASNPVFYFKCCGDMNASCCFRLQDWAMVLLVVMVGLIVISIFVNLLRCIFCY